jgi:O-antigen/teichoic acid export membrane protein
MHLRKAALWAMADQYFGFAVQFVASIILARYFIAPAELGLFSIAFVAVSLIAFLQDFGTVRYINDDRDLDADRIRAAFTLSLTVGWLIALGCTAMAWPLAAIYDDPRLVPITLVIAASYFLYPLAIVPQALRQRAMDFRSTAMIGMSASTANAAVSLTLAWMGWGALALACGALAQQIARVAVAQWQAGGLVPWPPRYANLRTMLDFGSTNTVLVICSLIITRLPELLIGRMLGLAAVGLFARATGLAAQLSLLLSGAVSSVFYPAFARVRDRGEPLGPPYLRVVASYTAVTWPAMAGLAIMAEPMVNLLYGPRWIETAPILVWIALGQICFIAFPLNADLPILLGHRAALLRRNVIDVLCALTLLMIALPYGIEAVAAARLAQGLLWVVNFGPFLWRVVGFSGRELAWVLARTALATLVAIAPVALSYALWAGPAQTGFLQMLVTAGLGVLAWLIALYLLRHPAYGEIARVIVPVLERARLAHLIPAAR